MRQDGSGKLFHPGWQAYYRGCGAGDPSAQKWQQLCPGYPSGRKGAYKGALQ